MALVRAGASGWVGHPKDIPGKPDFYFESARLAVFVDGCFWHGCAKCGHIPKTNQTFWAAKIDGNRKRHRKVKRQLTAQGIGSLRFWEHQLQEDVHRCVDMIFNRLHDQLS